LASRSARRPASRRRTMRELTSTKPRAERASSFGAVAKDYDAGRPTYPAELVAWALGARPLQVLDVGAGTGKLTQVLADAGHTVTAAEPLPDMIVVLSRRLRDVRTVTARAEALPLDSSVYQAIVVGQAFHWFDQTRALSEMARVAKPKAVLALFWNTYAGPETWLPYPRGVPKQSLQALYDHPLWAEPDHRTYAWNHRITPRSLLAFVRSHSSVACLPAAERDAYTRDVEPLASEVAREKTLPMVTHVWRSRLAA
jgi:ubiquinone/menaquinone biosynthesis C-methylase UbiE